MDNIGIELQEYVDAHGKNVFRKWLLALKDKTARARIRVRLNRIRLGNLGDCKSVGSGVNEIRVDYGPGYRVYFGRDGNRIVILLCGGSKKSQSSDIKKAQQYWIDYQGEVKVMTVTEKYEDNLKNDLLDPVEAAEYLKAALEDGSQEVFLMALRDVATAKGINQISKETHLNRENLYRILSTKGNPKLKSLRSVLQSVGLKLSIETC